MGMKEQWIPENCGIRVERKEINGIRQVGKGRTFVCIIRECQFYSKY